jgi:hypothetical protein
MAGEQAQQPQQGTGALTLDDAVDILTRPLTPSRNKGSDARQPASATSDLPVDAGVEPEDDDETDAPPETEADDEQSDAGTDEGSADEGTPEAPDKSSSIEPAYKVVIDGKETTIPLQELVSGYQRQAAFTQRSQVLANERRAFESERDAVVKERGQYARLLVSLEQQLGGEQEPDWAALEQNDPVNFAIESARWQQKRERMAAIASEKERLSEEARKDIQGKVYEHVTEQARQLLEKVPEYRDEAVRLKDRTAIKDFAVKSYGFTSDEIDQLVDHRAVLVLRDARAYRELTGKRGAVEKRVVDAGAPLPRNRSAAPAGTQQGRVRVADDRLSRTGRLADAVALELARSRARRSDGDGSGDH